MARETLKQQSKRKTRQLMTAAILATGAGQLVGGADAHAALILDIRAIPGAGYIVSNDVGAGKLVSVLSSGPGTVISMQVFGRVSGTDGINNEAMSLAGLSIASSTGGLLGNLQNFTAAPFNAASSQNGVQNDFDSDGDLDVGSLGTAAGGKIAYRAAASVPMQPANGATAIDANTSEILLGNVTFTVTAGSGTTAVQVIPRPGVAAGIAVWNEDGVATGKTVTTGIFGANPPGVMIGLEGIPTNLYWDANSNVAGAGGATPSGTWGVDNFWSGSATGTNATTAWSQGGTAIFSAGNDATGSFAVAVSGTQTVLSLVFEEGAVALSGGTIALSAGSIDVRSSGGASINSVITGSAGLIKQGTGTLTLSGVNTYTGATRLDAGTLSISADSNLGGSSTINFMGGSLKTTGSFSSSRAVTLNANASVDVASATTVTFAGLLSGPGALNKAGGGSLVLSAGNLYSGGTTVTGGYVVVSANGKLGSGPLTLDGGGVRMAAPFNFDSSGPTTLGPTGGTVDTNGNNVNFIQPLSGSGGLTKAGAGTLMLLSSSSYAGSTAITGGTLAVGAGATLSSASLENAGTLSGISTTFSFPNESSNYPGARINAIGSTLNFGAGDDRLVNFGRVNLIDSTFNGDLDSSSAGVVNSAGDVTFNGNITGGSLEVGNGTSSLAPGGSKFIAVNTVSVDGKLDLSDNHMVVRTSAFGSWNGTAYTGVIGLVASGRGNGTWANDPNAAGITTSQPNATAGLGQTMLGIATASEIFGIGATETLIWEGVLVAGDDAIIKYTYGGDANLSGFIDVDDYGQIDFNRSAGGVLTGWYNGDFNYDGVVNIDDYGIIDFAFNVQGPPLLVGASPLTLTSVPEPTGGLAASVVVVHMLRRRKRR